MVAQVQKERKTLHMDYVILYMSSRWPPFLCKLSVRIILSVYLFLIKVNMYYFISLYIKMLLFLFVVVVLFNCLFCGFFLCFCCFLFCFCLFVCLFVCKSIKGSIGCFILN